MLRFLVILLLIAFLALGAAVGYHNAELVNFDYLAGQTTIPLIALILGVFVIAVTLTLFVCMGRMVLLKSDVRRLRRKVDAVESELQSLRDLPLKDA